MGGLPGEPQRILETPSGRALRERVSRMIRRAGDRWEVVLGVGAVLVLGAALLARPERRR
jgi:hypothetical protein